MLLLITTPAAIYSAFTSHLICRKNGSNRLNNILAVTACTTIGVIASPVLTPALMYLLIVNNW